MALRRFIRVLSALVAVVAGASVMPAGAVAARNVYVGHLNSGLARYATAPDGSLQAPLTLASAVWTQTSLATTPDGSFLYAGYGATLDSGSIRQYAVASDGSLAELAPAALPSLEIEDLAVSPNGASLYVLEGGFWGTGAVARYAIAADGTLSATASTAAVTGAQPNDLSITPDGKNLYVSNWLEDTISQYSIGPDGSLTPMSPATVPTGPQPYRLAIDPSGKSLYVTNSHMIAESAGPPGSSVSQYSIEPDGSLAPKTPASVPAGQQAIGIAMAPDGKSLYVAESTEAGRILQFSTDSTGRLEAMVPFGVAAERQPFALAVSPDGASLYATNTISNSVGQYGIDSAGGLTPMAPPSVTALEAPEDLLVQPDQGPLASLTASVAPPGEVSELSGLTSGDPDGEVARYEWDFGDGTTAFETDPLAQHVYTQPGEYTVSLTVTDDEGCSTALIYTGHVVLCNGGPKAHVDREVVIAGDGGAPPPEHPEHPEHPVHPDHPEYPPHAKGRGHRHHGWAHRKRQPHVSPARPVIDSPA